MQDTTQNAVAIRRIPKDWAYWFTGLCDGEATFTSAAQWSRGHIHPRFAIIMQQDDKLLRKVESMFGFGSLCANQPSCVRKDGGHFGPRLAWSVDKRSDLQFLCEFFTKYPLRSKKQAEFELWRRFVAAYCSKTASFRQLIELAMKVSSLNERRSPFVVRAQRYLSELAASRRVREKPLVVDPFTLGAEIFSSTSKRAAKRKA
jgi:hypothetical protein